MDERSHSSCRFAGRYFLLFFFVPPFFGSFLAPVQPVSNCTLVQMACNRLAGIHQADPSLTFFRLDKLSEFVIDQLPLPHKEIDFQPIFFYFFFPLKKINKKKIFHTCHREELPPLSIQFLGRHHQLVVPSNQPILVRPRLASRTPC